MDIKKEIFRTYDIRGVYPDELNESTALNIGKALGTVLVKKGLKTIVVGFDDRSSSVSLTSAFILGLVSTGCHVTDIGLSITPVIHYLTCTRGFDAGVIVTASHNPVFYNGFRIDYSYATPFFGDDIESLYGTLITSTYVEGVGSHIKKPLNNYYLAFLQKEFSDLNNCDVKIHAECGNGATSEFITKVFGALKFNAIYSDCIINPAFPSGIPDPEDPVYIKSLAEKVLNTKADLGICFDVDGDRFGVVDGLGQHYFNDKLLLLFAQDVLKSFPGGKVVFDVKSSEIIFHEITRLEGIPKMLKTGHPFFMQEMKTHAILGGEFSGHMYFADEYFGFDDGIYACLRLLRLLVKSGKSLADLMLAFPNTHQTGELKIKCSDNKKFELLQNLEKTLKKNENISKLLTLDGVRAYLKDIGWFLIRASNTSPYLSLCVEAYNSPSDISVIKDFALEQLKEVFLDVKIDL